MSDPVMADVGIAVVKKIHAIYFTLNKICEENGTHYLVSIQLSTLSDWVNPCYLDIGTHTQVQSQFEVDSQIELSDFLLVCMFLNNT